MKFNHLNVPTHWRNYWSRYPEGHTILEALIQWVSQVDSMVDNQNKLNDNVEQFRNEIDVFVERFDERLQVEVTQTLNDWQESGFLEVVISEALQWQLDNYIATNEQDKLSLTAQLQQNTNKINSMVVNVMDFGVVGDGIADDTLALQEALDYCEINGRKLYSPALTCRVTDTINVKCDCELSEMEIILNSVNVGVGIKVGHFLAGNETRNKVMLLPTVTNTQRTTGEYGKGIGVLFGNCHSNRFLIRQVSNFETGIQCGGASLGFAYNTLDFQTLFNNKYNLVLKPYDNAGWINQNLFVNGRAYHTSDFSAEFGGSLIGARNIVLDSDNNGINANIFLNISIESNTVEYGIELAGLIGQNVFENIRFEGATANKILLNSKSSGVIGANTWLCGAYAVNLDFIKIGIGTIDPQHIVNISGNSMRGDSTAPALSMTATADSFAHILGYQAGKANIKAYQSDTNWSYRLNAMSFLGKLDSNAYNKIKLNWESNPTIEFGNGTLDTLVQMAASIGAGFAKLYISNVTEFYSAQDNTTSLGNPSSRWKNIYATTGTINTSDERVKSAISPIEDRVMSAWSKVEFLSFKFKDAVAKKGEDGARIHFGVIAQRVKEAFEEEGLNAFDYGLLCYDKWETVYDDDNEVLVPSGDLYGIRYEEALALECAYQRWLGDKRESRLLALESLINN